MPEDENRTTDLGQKSEVPVEYFAKSASLETNDSRSPVESSTPEHVSFNDAPAGTMVEAIPEQQNGQVPFGQNAQTVESVAPAQKVTSPNTAGVLVLQWLTYAFWGWTLVALYWLTSLCVQYFISDSSQADSYSSTYSNDMLAYSLAAVVVLFIISIICDFVYSKFEPQHKSGAAMVIMIFTILPIQPRGHSIRRMFSRVNSFLSMRMEKILFRT